MSTLDEALDATRIGGRLGLALLLCGLVMVIDGYDLTAMPLAVPHIVRLWGIAPGSFGVALSAVLVGLGIGAVFVAPLGDRHGRRLLITASTVAIGLTTLGTATGTGVASFALWRLLTGVALGACLPNVTALVAELAPRRRRAGVLTIVSCGVSIGGMAAGFVAPPLVGLGGWQMIFVASGVGTLAIAAVLLVVLPESPKLLLARGDHARLAAFCARANVPYDPEWAVAGPPAQGPRLSLLAPLGARHRFATFVFAGLYTVNALALYMLTSWLPTLLPQAGFAIDQGARLTSLLQGGGLIGGLALSFFLDRGRTVAALAGAYLIVALGLVAFGAVPATPAGWGVLLLIVGGGIAGAHLAIMAVGTSFYPPQMLSAAIGLAVAVARLGAIAGPLLGGWLISMGLGAAPFLLAMLVPVLICAAGVTLIPAARRTNIQES